MTKDYGKGKGRKNRIAKAGRKAAWNLAISEGRVVKTVTREYVAGTWEDRVSFAAYATVLATQKALEHALDAGLNASIVERHLAQD